MALGADGKKSRTVQAIDAEQKLVEAKRNPLDDPHAYNAATVQTLGGRTTPKSNKIFDENVVQSQNDESRRAFHSMKAHAQKAIIVLNKKLKEPDQPVADTAKNRALLGQIAILHDLMYNIDNGTANNSILKGALEAAPEKRDEKGKVTNEGEHYLKANQAELTPIAYALFNKIKDFKPSEGIKEPLKLPPAPSMGHNELYSAIIAERLLMEQGVPKKERFTIIAAIINTVPFTTKAYQENYAKILDEVAKDNFGNSPETTALVKETIEIDNFFTNNFDIANYKSHSELIKYTKLMQAEQDPANHDKALGIPKEDLKYIIESSRNNFFHGTDGPGSLLHKLNNGAQVFRGPNADELNEALKQNLKAEVAFKKLRTLGAAIAMAEEAGLTREEFLSALGTSDKAVDAGIHKGTLVTELDKYNNKPTGSDIPQGYTTDANAASCIRDENVGIDRALQHAERAAELGYDKMQKVIANKVAQKAQYNEIKTLLISNDPKSVNEKLTELAKKDSEIMAAAQKSVTTEGPNRDELVANMARNLLIDKFNASLNNDRQMTQDQRNVLASQVTVANIQNDIEKRNEFLKTRGAEPDKDRNDNLAVGPHTSSLINSRNRAVNPGNKSAGINI